MSREKHIEQMAHELCGMDIACKDCRLDKTCLARNSADIIYNAGYRKIVQCKDCEDFYKVGSVGICRHWNFHSTNDDAYCSFAKMNGGD